MLIGALRPQAPASASIADAPQPPPTPDDADELVLDPEAPGAAPPPPAAPDQPLSDPDAPAVPAADPDAEAGARLVALDMALSGTPREDVERYLAEHFPVADRAALLDDVYAAAGA